MDLRKIASGAATFINRAVQVTEERLGQASKTELDAHVEQLLRKVDATQHSTERILKQVDCLLQPNPAYRMEGLVLETLDRRRPDRLTPVEELGLVMIDAALDYGTDTQYGNILLKCGQTEQRLGQEEKEFGHGVSENYMQPLRSFLDQDLKNLQRERRVMETRRLDLDVSRSRLRRARNENARQVADEEVRKAQTEFDRQLGVVRHLAEGVLSSHTHLRKVLADFIEQQMLYFAKCHQHLTELSRQLSSTSQFHAPSGSEGNAVGGASRSTSRQARVLYDYHAGDDSELSLHADELITVFCANAATAETEMWLVAERDHKQGKVPSAYVEIID